MVLFVFHSNTNTKHCQYYSLYMETAGSVRVPFKYKYKTLSVYSLYMETDGSVPFNTNTKHCQYYSLYMETVMVLFLFQSITLVH